MSVVVAIHVGHLGLLHFGAVKAVVDSDSSSTSSECLLIVITLEGEKFH